MDRDDKFWHDLNEREEAWAYEKAEFDKIAHYVDGEAKGKAEGRAEGKKEKAKEIALKLLALNTPIDIIFQSTGLSIEEIKKLKS